jgi:hypothetical protein
VYSSQQREKMAFGMVLGALILGGHTFSSVSQPLCTSGTSRSPLTMVVHIFSEDGSLSNEQLQDLILKIINK